MASRPRIILEAFQNFLLKQIIRVAVNCLSEGRNVLFVMPTGYGKRFKFQLFVTAVMIKKGCKGQHSDTVISVTCPLSIGNRTEWSTIQGEIGRVISN